MPDDEGDLQHPITPVRPFAASVMTSKPAAPVRRVRLRKG